MKGYKCVRKNNNGFKVGEVYYFDKISILNDNRDDIVFQLKDSPFTLLSMEYMDSYFKPLKIIYEINLVYTENGTIIDRYSKDYIFEDRHLARRSFSNLCIFVRNSVTKDRVFLKESSDSNSMHIYNDNIDVRASLKERVVTDSDPFIQGLL